MYVYHSYVTDRVFLKCFVKIFYSPQNNVKTFRSKCLKISSKQTTNFISIKFIRITWILLIHIFTLKQTLYRLSRLPFENMSHCYSYIRATDCELNASSMLIKESSGITFESNFKDSSSRVRFCLAPTLAFAKVVLLRNPTHNVDRTAEHRDKKTPPIDYVYSLGRTGLSEERRIQTSESQSRGNEEMRKRKRERKEKRANIMQKGDEKRKKREKEEGVSIRTFSSRSHSSHTNVSRS